MKKKKWITTAILILFFCVGLSLLLYPTVSNWWNQYHQSRAIACYAESVLRVTREEYQEMLESAQAYNAGVAATGGGGAVLSSGQKKEYESQLNVTGTGVMGYVDITKIHCTLPIYHGTEETVLQIGAGHIAGTSLPVGGESTHCVLSGHRGLPSARLFTDIDQLEKGDIFTIRTLSETLTYEVDQIRTVLPYETNDLCVVPGEDFCTLVTCTPYGVNTHRLLVRGRRIETKPGAVTVTANAILIRPAKMLPAMVFAPLTLFLIGSLLRAGRKNPRSVMDQYRRVRDEKK